LIFNQISSSVAPPLMPALKVRVYKFSSPKSIKEIIESCGKQAFVEYAEPNRIYKAQVEPAGTLVSPKKAQE